MPPLIPELTSGISGKKISMSQLFGFATYLRTRHTLSSLGRRRAFVQGYLVFWDKALVAKKRPFSQLSVSKSQLFCKGIIVKKQGNKTNPLGLLVHGFPIFRLFNTTGKVVFRM